MKVFKFSVAIVLAALIVVALWYFRPWSDYSPAKLSQLQHPDKLVYNFQHMSEFMPARSIAKSTQPYEWNVQTSPLSLNYEFNGQTKSLDQFLSESSSLSLMVIKDGIVKHENYLNGASRESLFTSWSVAKSFVATVIAMAINEGKISSLQDQVKDYAPQYQGSAYGETTLESLLTMSSGIDFVEDYNAQDSDVRAFFFDSFIMGKNPDEFLLPYKRGKTELTQFEYISPNSHVLSAVLRGVYNKSLVQIMAEKIWQPLGMEGDANWLHHRPDEAGQALGYCCLNARTRDYARLGTFYLEAYQQEGLGSRLLPKGWIDKVRYPANDDHYPKAERYQGRGYSWHFWLPNDAPGVFFAAGIYGQYIWIDVEQNLVIACNSADPEWTARYAETEAVFKAISDHYAASGT